MIYRFLTGAGMSLVIAVGVAGNGDGTVPSVRPADAAVANAPGVHVKTNFLAVRLLYGPLLIQNSLVYRSISASTAGSIPAACVRIPSRTSRIWRLCACRWS